MDNNKTMTGMEDQKLEWITPMITDYDLESVTANGGSYSLDAGGYS
ncbi:MAG: hypothetical protein HQK56_17350 [Deltaproteobacteria bacterium]|nr:hypothetical protein [Deltaproteobacteria bacterium]